MKAYVLQKHGGIENLLLTELPVPNIAEHEVLIRTKSVSINRVDSFVRQHDFAVPVFYKRTDDTEPIILGWDVAGVIEKVGDKVKDFKPGDEVFGLVNFFGKGRTHAEYVTAPAEHLAIKPKQISFEQAAAACLTALTAWQAINMYGQVKAGDKVLIYGAAGGVGHFAVQLARLQGAYVIGVGSPHNRAFIMDIGADEFLDYKHAEIEQIVTDADLVIDPLPTPHLLKSLNTVRSGGRLIHLLPHEDKDGQVARIVKTRNLFLHRVVVSSDGQTMKKIADLLATGEFKPHVFKTFGFDKLPQAHKAIDTGKKKGKIVVNIT